MTTKHTIIAAALALSAVTAAHAQSDNTQAAVPDSAQAPMTAAPDTAAAPFSGVRYAMSYDDWAAGRWHTFDDAITTDERTAAAQLLGGGGGVKFSTGNAAYDRALKREVFAVQHDTTLYVNLRGMKCEGVAFGNNYTRAWKLAGGRLAFIFYPVGKKENRQMRTASMFGLLGAAAAATVRSQQMKNHVLYTVSPAGNTAIRATKADIDGLLDGHGELRQAFDAQCDGDTYQAENALQYLMEAGLVD